MSIHSQWPIHAIETGGNSIAGRDVNHPVDARRCTVQLSTGRLYLDAVASSATALLGHDPPPMSRVNKEIVQKMLSSLAPGYTCVAMTSSFPAAAELAARISKSFARAGDQIVGINALNGEPAPGIDFQVVYENETLGRTGRWLASTAWGRVPELVVVGEALALGSPFGAVLARRAFPADHDAEGGALARVAAAIMAVESEGLLQHGGELGNYLMSRLLAMRETCPQIESVKGVGLSIRVVFAKPLAATQIRRRMCERGVLAGVDRAGRLAIDPPLPLRIAEADVVTGALRGALLGLPTISNSPCCAACESGS